MSSPVLAHDAPGLTRWAAVALAARCARRLAPVPLRLWPDMPADDAAVIGRAAELVASAAATATPPAPDAFAAIVADVQGVQARYREAGLGRTARSLNTVFQHAGRALDAGCASDPLHEDAVSAVDAVAGMALHSAEPEFREAVEADVAALLAASLAGGWTDDTPVPPAVFDPL